MHLSKNIKKTCYKKEGEREKQKKKKFQYKELSVLHLLTIYLNNNMAAWLFSSMSYNSILSLLILLLSCCSLPVRNSFRLALVSSERVPFPHHFFFKYFPTFWFRKRLQVHVAFSFPCPGINYFLRTFSFFY